MEQFHKDEWVKEPADIFTLRDRFGQGLQLLKNREGWGDKSANALFTAIEDKRKIPLARLIFGLGIIYFFLKGPKKLGMYCLFAYIAIIVGGIQLGLSALFYSVVDEGRPSIGLSALYTLRYLAVGFCGYWLVPEIFIRFRLADSRD